MPTLTMIVTSLLRKLVQHAMKRILMATDVSGPSARTMTLLTDVSFSQDPQSASKQAGQGTITLVTAGMGCPPIIHGGFLISPVRPANWQWLGSGERKRKREREREREREQYVIRCVGVCIETQYLPPPFCTVLSSSKHNEHFIACTLEKPLHCVFRTCGLEYASILGDNTLCGL